MKLAAIAFDLRFANMNDDEAARIPAPWGYRNIPQPTKTETRTRTRFGKGVQPTYTETTEHFADGSQFTRSF